MIKKKGKNPDNPTECDYFLEGGYCLEKTIQESYVEEICAETNEANWGTSKFKWIECPFYHTSTPMTRKTE